MFGPAFRPSRKASRAERRCYDRVPKNLATNNGAVAPARAPAPEGSSKQRRCGAGCLAVAGLQGDPSAAHIMRKRSEEHTSELQSLMRISYDVFCLKKKSQ